MIYTIGKILIQSLCPTMGCAGSVSAPSWGIQLRSGRWRAPAICGGEAVRNVPEVVWPPACPDAFLRLAHLAGGDHFRRLSDLDGWTHWPKPWQRPSRRFRKSSGSSIRRCWMPTPARPSLSKRGTAHDAQSSGDRASQHLAAIGRLFSNSSGRV